MIELRFPTPGQTDITYEEPRTGPDGCGRGNTFSCCHVVVLPILQQGASALSPACTRAAVILATLAVSEPESALYVTSKDSTLARNRG
ncbi:hypothetical protein JYU34_013217 [Plutella xylostella]|uniref:Uncharacterized protein n=1 Tax=Plutella xylostella TaxID=51655 RepID=A0ABQ7Q9G6_PLUXY|nr:hypothetical protein JYU34_013217 [Plutella xylostella]